VRIAADAAYAVAFEPDSDVLHALDLQRGELVRVELSTWAEIAVAEGDGGVPAQPRIADVALARDGASAWLALRDEQALLRVPLPAAATRPEDIELHALDGQPSDRLQWASGERALFVYAAAPADGRATLVPLSAPDEPQRIALAAAPGTVLATDGGEALGLLHAAAELPAGYTLVRARDGAARFRQTDSPPVAIALSGEAEALATIVAASAGDDAELHVIDFETLAVTVQALPAQPRAVGFVGAGRFAYAQLAHPDGRLTFVEIASGKVRTATGFLIGERIRE
jgi:hypothetical protein